MMSIVMLNVAMFIVILQGSVAMAVLIQILLRGAILGVLMLSIVML
jgi:hypothetical protein